MNTKSKSLESLYLEQEQKKFEVNDNYFIRMNEAYTENTAKSPSETSKIFTSLRQENKTSWWEIAVDGFKNPGAALNWAKIWLLETVGNNWFTKLIGINEDLTKEKLKVLDTLNIPHIQASKILTLLLKESSYLQSLNLKNTNSDQDLLTELAGKREGEQSSTNPHYKLLKALLTLKIHLSKFNHKFVNLSQEQRKNTVFWEGIFKEAQIPEEQYQNLIEIFINGKPIIETLNAPSETVQPKDQATEAIQ